MFFFFPLSLGVSEQKSPSQNPAKKNPHLEDINVFVAILSHERLQGFNLSVPVGSPVGSPDPWMGGCFAKRIQKMEHNGCWTTQHDWVSWTQSWVLFKIVRKSLNIYLFVRFPENWGCPKSSKSWWNPMLAWKQPCWLEKPFMTSEETIFFRIITHHIHGDFFKVTTGFHASKLAEEQIGKRQIADWPDQQKPVQAWDIDVQYFWFPNPCVFICKYCCWLDPMMCDYLPWSNQQVGQWHSSTLVNAPTPKQKLYHPSGGFV